MALRKWKKHSTWGAHGGLIQTKHCSIVWLQCIDSNTPGITRPSNRERKRHPEARTTTSGPADKGESSTGQDSDGNGNVKTDTRTSRVDPYGEELHDTTWRVLLSSTATWTPMCMWMKCWQILCFLSCMTISPRKTVFFNRMVLGLIQLESHSS